MLSKSFNITIDSGVSAQGHGKEVVHGLNATEKWFIFHSMAPMTMNIACHKLNGRIDYQDITQSKTLNECSVKV